MNERGPMDSMQLERYLRERVLPALGAADSRFDLELVKNSGRNLVWFLTTGDGGSFVLKAISKRFRIKNIIWAHRFLSGRGLPVPKLVYADRAWKTAERTGFYFACEERVRGTALDDLGKKRVDCLGAVAGLFASMHQLASFRWGKLKTFQVFGFRQYLLRRIIERLQALGDAGCAIMSSECLSWFEKYSSGLGPVQRFNLCHGDVNMKNILLGPAGEIRLIDTEAFKFLPFEMEYFRLAYALCGFDPIMHEQFRKLYAAGSSKDNLHRLEAGSDLFHAFVLLEIAWYFNKKLKDPMLPDSSRATLTEIRARALERLSGMLRR